MIFLLIARPKLFLLMTIKFSPRKTNCCVSRRPVKGFFKILAILKFQSKKSLTLLETLKLRSWTVSTQQQRDREKQVASLPQAFKKFKAKGLIYSRTSTRSLQSQRAPSLLTVNIVAFSRVRSRKMMKLILKDTNHLRN